MSLGLGLLAGAIFHTPSAAAQDTTRVRRDSAFVRDSIVADSLERVRARQDSIRAARAADSIKAPIAGVVMPALTDVGQVYRWDRSQLFASGALTLTDLLARIPGVTTFQSGWIASPQVAALGGEFGRVRIFLDGFELDEMNPRAGLVQDLSIVPLWTMEEVRIERTAREIRVHMRTWTTRSTTAATRVDVATGDFDTNTYRGYYAKRFQQGLLLQAGAYQYGTQDNALGDADHLALIARAGWAKGKLSVVATYYALGLDRSDQPRLEVAGRPDLPRQESRYTQAYFRMAYGDPMQDGLWGQVGAGSFQFKLTRGDSVFVTPGQPPDTTVFKRDTLRTRPQLMGALGYNVGGLRFNAISRVRRVRDIDYISAATRATFERKWLSASIHAERRLPESSLTTDASFRILPLPFLAFAGSLGRTSPVTTGDFPTTLAATAEAGLKLGRAWLTGGAFMRDTAALAAPIIFDTALTPTATGRLTGTYATIRGKVFADLGLDVLGVRWDQPHVYRPRYQARTQLYIDTEWRSAVPSGNLNIFAAIAHEYRDRAVFPFIDADEAPTSSVYRTWNFHIEVRVLRAVVTYQFRNILGFPYEQVPGFRMPRQSNYYGVRWEFVN
ncbi:MAG: Plug domain-containing protein [Gemmatimonadaceae bacterium]